MNQPIRSLIVDDDAGARDRIRSALAPRGTFVVVGECRDGREAIHAIRSQRPDLVFLDVQLPAVDGFGVVEAIGPEQMPVTIFVSAHPDHALRAFDAHATDYLLKPFDDDRFARALARACTATTVRSGGTPHPRLPSTPLPAPSRPQYPELLAVKSGDQFHFIEVSEIEWIEADGNYIRLHLARLDRLVHRTLAEMEERLLDPGRFVRIHRSTIVNLSRVAFLEPQFHGDLSVVLKDGTRLTCSRRFRARLQDRVFFTG